MSDAGTPHKTPGPVARLDADALRSFRALAAELTGIDQAVYRQFERDPLTPILGLGPVAAPIAFLGRDPGREEVRHGEPFIGAGGRRLRETLHAYRHGTPGTVDLDLAALRHAGRDFFWLNTVPYKPAGNRAWPMAVKRRFQPLIHELLAAHWRGRRVVTLGREAFLWFGIGRSRAERARLAAFWQRADRFESVCEIEVAPAATPGKTRRLEIAPLPHPSPLNATWYRYFPALLRQRLAQFAAGVADV